MNAWIVRSDGGGGIDAFEAGGFVGLRGGTPDAVVNVDLHGADDDEITAAVKTAGLPAPYTRMLRSFVLDMEPGDLVVSPGPREVDQPEVLIGEVASDYRYEPDQHDLRHRRDVSWACRVGREEFPASFWRGAVSALTATDPGMIPPCE